jgi:hypothetical protein
MTCAACTAFAAAERHAIEDLDGDLPEHELDGCTCPPEEQEREAGQ